MDLPAHIENSLTTRGLLRRVSRVLVAVSGGLDSMVLLRLLHGLATGHRWHLTVAHFNHQLRGRSSDADERLVRRTAERLGLRCVVSRGNVRALAKREGISIEMAARRLRHAFLASAAQTSKSACAALAHHADDQVELFFLRLFRGSGPEGLAGMRWKSTSFADRTLTLVRPLLDVSKAELLKFATAEGVSFREDASNASLEMMRNRVRHELLPQLRKDFQPALDTVILRTMDLLEAEAECVGTLAQAWLRKPKDFAALPLAVQRRVRHLQLTKLGVTPDFDWIEALRMKPNTPLMIAPDVVLHRDVSGRVSPSFVADRSFEFGKQRVVLTGKSGTGSFAGMEYRWESRRARAERPDLGLNEECFDGDRVGEAILLRHWQPGDRFQPIGMRSAVKLQDLFTNAKVSVSERRTRVVACTESGKLWWVEGLRMGEEFKVTPATTRWLVWKWRRATSRIRGVVGDDDGFDR